MYTSIQMFKFTDYKLVPDKIVSPISRFLLTYRVSCQEVDSKTLFDFSFLPLLLFSLSGSNEFVLPKIPTFKSSYFNSKVYPFWRFYFKTPFINEPKGYTYISQDTILFC